MRGLTLFRVGPVLLLAALLAGGCVAPRSPVPRVDATGRTAEQVERARHNLEVFDSAWNLVKRKYYDPGLQRVDWDAAAMTYGPKAVEAPDDKELYAAMEDMLGLLKDSHMHVMTPEAARAYRTQQIVRTGIAMTRIDGRWVVTEVLPGSPADKAGVKSGWIAVSRNGQTFGEVMDLHPREGEAAIWEFLDPADRPVSLSLVAHLFSTAPRQESRELAAGVVYLRFDAFDFHDLLWMRRELFKFRQAPAVVVDLRHNGGGDVVALDFIAGDFFDHTVYGGTFITRSGGRWRQRSISFFSPRYAGRVALLTGGSTGSAAEIFAAALQDTGRATLFGSPTAGAVKGSRFYGLPDGGVLQLSMSDYVTLKGVHLESNGVRPDNPVASTLSDLRSRRDAELDAAVRFLGSQ